VKPISCVSLEAMGFRLTLNPSYELRAQRLAALKAIKRDGGKILIATGSLANQHHNLSNIRAASSIAVSLGGTQRIFIDKNITAKSIL